jgi:hypothetical protein
MTHYSNSLLEQLAKQPPHPCSRTAIALPQSQLLQFSTLWLSPHHSLCIAVLLLLPLQVSRQ